MARRELVVATVISAVLLLLCIRVALLPVVETGLGGSDENSDDLSLGTTSMETSTTWSKRPSSLESSNDQGSSKLLDGEVPTDDEEAAQAKAAAEESENDSYGNDGNGVAKLASKSKQDSLQDDNTANTEVMWEPNIDGSLRIRQKSSKSFLASNLEALVSLKDRGFIGMFLHIHKGGGTTICSEAILHGEASSFGLNCNLILPKDQAEYIIGHEATQARIFSENVARGFTFLANEWVMPDNLLRNERIRYLALLRDPLSRTESHYKYAMKQLRSRPRSSVMQSNPQCEADSHTTLKEMRISVTNVTVAAELRKEWLTSVPDNWQTRAVCGMACATLPFGGLQREHVELAKYRIEHDFHALGVLEHLSESLLIFGETLQWPASTRKPVHSRKAPSRNFFRSVEDAPEEIRKQTIVQEALRWYDRANIYDVELYNFALELFYKELDRRGMPYERRTAKTASSLSQSEAQTQLVDLSVDCKSPCCNPTNCGHIGTFWSRVARSTALVPATNCG